VLKVRFEHNPCYHLPLFTLLIKSILF
jgi:hypothetical protein